MYILTLLFIQFSLKYNSKYSNILFKMERPLNNIKESNLSPSIVLYKRRIKLLKDEKKSNFDIYKYYKKDLESLKNFITRPDNKILTKNYIMIMSLMFFIGDIKKYSSSVSNKLAYRFIKNHREENSMVIVHKFKTIVRLENDLQKIFLAIKKNINQNLEQYCQINNLDYKFLENNVYPVLIEVKFYDYLILKLNSYLEFLENFKNSRWNFTNKSIIEK